MSRADGEPLAATASRVENWLLLEYRGVWAHDAIDGSTLSAEVKAHLRELRVALPHGRPLFVRSRERRVKDGLLAFFARSEEARTELRRIELERYDDLLELDVASAGAPVEHPLFLVCTHGKHDRCCAVYGRPLYDSVRELVDDDWVWQSAHIGGDRFAGNLVALPDGVYYGRVDAGEALPVVEAALDGRVYLPHYRGRSCHPFPAQAAERAVREETGLLGVFDVSVRGVARTEQGWLVTVVAAGREFEVDVTREEGEPTHLTCSTTALRRPRHYVAGNPRVAGTPRARAS
jgi:hypothetical protein